jgi:hypothetical protein
MKMKNPHCRNISKIQQKILEREEELTMVCSDQDMLYSIKEKEPTLVSSDQDMSYPYSIKGKEPTLVCSDEDM